ncbi:hypothetical protein GGS21DRAFT_543844 [Xylaria nigripes]|nr:hypothetical protein GGS21DRAFT_543844 [Xylaria nigripes]
MESESKPVFRLEARDPIPDLACLQASRDPSAQIVLSLRYDMDIDRNISYEAISYYQSSSDTATVLIDWTKMEIPKALENALRVRRSMDKDLFFWADILSGPPDMNERFQEIPIHPTRPMELLENSARLFCWLGPATKMTQTAFEIIELLGTNTMPKDRLSSQTAVLDCIGYPWRKDNEASPYYSAEDGIALWREFVSIFKSPFWDSLKCVSEILMVRKPFILRGKYCVSWKNYEKAAQFLFNVGYQPLFEELLIDRSVSPTQWPWTVNICKPLRYMGVAARTYRYRRQFSAMDMLRAIRSCNANELWEWVFSTRPITIFPRSWLRLPTSATHGSFQSISIQQLMTKLAHDLFFTRQDLQVWRDEYPPWPETIHPSIYRMLLSLSMDLEIGFFGDDRLTVYALPVDQVAYVSDIFTSLHGPYLCFKEYQNISQNIPQLAGLPGFDWLFFKTIVLNNYPYGRADPVFNDLVGQLPDASPQYQSFLAEEELCQILDCTIHEWTHNQDLWAIANQRPETRALADKCGCGYDYRAAVRHRAVGRRFIITYQHSLAMSAVEGTFGRNLRMEGNRECTDNSNTGVSPDDIIALCAGSCTAIVLRARSMSVGALARYTTTHRRMPFAVECSYVGECFYPPGSMLSAGVESASEPQNKSKFVPIVIV